MVLQKDQQILNVLSQYNDPVASQRYVLRKKYLIRLSKKKTIIK